MTGESVNLAVRIMRFVDDRFPGWVECEFVDADGRRHTIKDKVPVFTTESLDSASLYPRDGSVSCTPLSRWRDDGGRDLVRVTLACPFAVESTDGLTEFVVLLDQLSA